ncbi:MAG: anaerobic sulfatase maturase [Gemmatimonadales bacterium]|nr:MAG: anaerobic sulfatase maturase [Gemmatimonadales bacterium]
MSLPPVPPFHIMIKPRGPICNLDCSYCYYLSKEEMYPGSAFKMTDQTLEGFTRDYIRAQPVPEVVFSWQGGEPLLMGLDFFERAVGFQQAYTRPGMRISNTLQTNGTLLNDEWCRFFREHRFLVGLSLDGPAPLHDAYRVNKGGKPTHAAVMEGADLLRRHQVEYNILATVHAANVDHPLEVYRFLRDEVKISFVQFIPIVQRENDTGYQEGTRVTERSVNGRAYGNFLNAIFNEWVCRDVGRVFVQMFDVTLAGWVGHPPGLCIFDERCGRALALEHNGDLYSCDHYVEPRYHLGNTRRDPLLAMVGSGAQGTFGAAKRDTLPAFCMACDVRYLCNGECPRNRVLKTPDGEEGLNYLCDGYKAFFTHSGPAMKFMADALKAGRPPAGIMREFGPAKYGRGVL